MTWVPPAYRRAGEPWPPTGMRPRRPHSRWWLPVAGSVGTVLAVAAAYFLTIVVAFFNTVCNDPPSVVQAHQNSLRIWVIAVWVLAAGVPVLVAGLAKVRQRATLPWVITAVAVAGIGVAIGATITPSTWCMF